MSVSGSLHPLCRLLSNPWLLCAWGILALLPGRGDALAGPPDTRLAAAKAQAAAAEPRVEAGKCVTPAGTLIRREGAGPTWQLVPQDAALHSGDLLVALPGAALDSRNGGVRLTLLADLDGTSPFPIIESAVVLHDSPDVDLDFSLDRGRINLTNRKQKGPARVRARVGDNTWLLTLAEPDAQVGLELYGRWPRGTRFRKDAPGREDPVQHLIILALHGQVDVKHRSRQHALKAPPGPALLEWDSVTGGDQTPHRLDKLPSWARPEESSSELAQRKKAALAQFRQLTLTKGREAALQQLLNSDNPDQRRLAILALAALDELSVLGPALMKTKHADVWDNGIQALRHWIGRGPGQDQKLYQRLVENAQFTPVEAENILQLLHSFGDAELARPETYETLLDYLESDRPGMRALAYWHLYRLVPAGRKIGYNPVAAQAERQQAVKEWRKLMPRGKVPPRVSGANDSERVK